MGMQTCWTCALEGELGVNVSYQGVLFAVRSTVATLSVSTQMILGLKHPNKIGLLFTQKKKSFVVFKPGSFLSKLPQNNPY
jgi:hypothetical protein